MKSAVNGGLQLSVLDGWWAEGYDGENGWGLPGEVDSDHHAQDERDAAALHQLLDEQVLPTFYDRDARRGAGRVAGPRPRLAEDARAPLQRHPDAVRVSVRALSRGLICGKVTPGRGVIKGSTSPKLVAGERPVDMAPSADHTEPRASELAELSALADDTLDPARRAAVEARIAASPELTARYERERRVVLALREARSTDRAPERLRARIDAARPTRATATRRRFAYSGGLAGALAAIALALVLALPSGGPGAPSVADAAALATRGPDRGGACARSGPSAVHPASERGRGLLPELDAVARLDGGGGPHRPPGRAHGGHRLLRVARPADRLHDRGRARPRRAGGPQDVAERHRAAHAHR